MKINPMFGNRYKIDIRKRSTGWLFGAFFLAVISTAVAEDWPTYQYDIHRSGTTAEKLNLSALKEQWAYRSPMPPQTAWAGPAKWDAYANLNGLRSMRNYDPAFYTVVVDDRLYFGSSADDSAYCLNTETGEEQWSYCTDGAIRIAPMVADGKVYFGSDDGNAYCLQADDGSLVWRYKPSPDEFYVPSNGRFISLWPCRSGVLVDGGKAYFACALLPWKISYLCAVDAETGLQEGDGVFQNTFEKVTMEGALVASPSKLYVPQGRRAPIVFSRTNGKHVGTLKGGGGIFVLLTPDSKIFHGPGNKAGWITASDAESRDKVASFDSGNCLIATADTSYILLDDAIAAVSRSERKPLWTQKCHYPYCMILSGDTLIAGGDYEIAAFRASDGEKIWTQKVDGRAYGLTVANGGLFVSTHTGTIHAFREG